MFGTKQTDRRNYRSLVIAGIGTIGASLITLGRDQFQLFEKIFAVDRDANCLTGLQDSGILCRSGDVTEPKFLRTLMAEVPRPALFVNLCSGTDNIRIRNNLLPFHAAYLDSCASTTGNPVECRFSRLMPYTYTEIASRRPHWLCWGINPGLVEIMARRMLADLPGAFRGYDVAVYEFDRLQNGADAGRKAAVAWCPDALIEEVMLSPSLEIIEGRPLEDRSPGARYCMVSWDDHTIPARLVAHEDIWNLTEIPAVRNGRFYYSLNPAVMDILDLDDTEKARELLYVPGKNDTVDGLEQIAVQVSGGRLSSPETVVWTEDHGATWDRFGVNAVQYQTAKSLLLAVMLLQRTEYGLKPHSNNAANLPIASADWQVFDRFMEELGIDWQDGAHLNLHVSGI